MPASPKTTTKMGALATVLGSIKIPPELKFPFTTLKQVKYLYSVRWHDDPRPVFVMDYRLARVDK